ncbi:MAG: AraC family transcriptional regulator [Asticcacaulis sp.]
MSLIRKTLWYVESHLDSDLSLGEIARALGVSRFHITRLFATLNGQSLMGYVKARRLSEAAKRLAPDSDILDIALSAGYGSHAAFSRAFRAEFGVSPKVLRSLDNRTHLKLTEPFQMNDVKPAPIQTPKRIKAPAITFAGLVGTYRLGQVGSVPAQWQAFREHMGQIDGQKGNIHYGVSYKMTAPDIFNYMSGVEITGTPDLPKGFETLKVAAHDYAVFIHEGHVSTISQTWRNIYDSWMPELDLRPAYSACFERMDERFDPMTGTGVVEIWIPVG